MRFSGSGSVAGGRAAEGGAANGGLVEVAV